MPETGAASAKVCVVCAANVADKPRVKDAAGRYMCKPCAEKKTATSPSANGKAAPAAKPAPKAAGKGAIGLAPEPGFDPVMASLVAGSQQATSTSCPNCKGWVKEGQLLCTSCGYNLQEGKQIRTRVQKEKAPKEAKSAPSGKSRWHVGERGESVPMIAGIGMFLLSAGAFIGMAVAPDVAIALVLVNMVLSGILYLAVLVQAYQAGLGTFLLLLLSQFIPIAGFVVYIYFLLTKCESQVVKMAGLGSMAGGIIGVVVMFAMSPDMLEKMKNRNSSLPSHHQVGWQDAPVRGVAPMAG